MDIKERASEIVKIFKKLKELNLGISCFDEFDNLRTIGNEFIRNGETKSGSIKVTGTKRIIKYHFGDKVECCLKYDETV